MNLSRPWQQVDARTHTAREVSLETEELYGSSIAVKKIAITLVILTVFIVVMLKLFNSVLLLLDKPIGEVVVNGELKYIQADKLAQAIASSIEDPLLTLNIRQVRTQVTDEPWVYKADVKRNWPPAIEVSLIEQVPIARWGDKGLVNQYGDIYWPEMQESYRSLPRFEGPSYETNAIMQQYYDLNPLFLQAGLKLTGLRLESRGAWTLELENGVNIIVGRENLMPRLRRFMQIYREELAQSFEKIEQIDIRYTNGVAVKWREIIEQENAG